MELAQKHLSVDRNSVCRRPAKLNNASMEIEIYETTELRMEQLKSKTSYNLWTNNKQNSQP